MKQPKLSDLKIDLARTRAMRDRMAKKKHIEVTIHPIQEPKLRIISNQLSRIEKEVAQLRRRLAA